MTEKEPESWKFGEQTKKAWLAHSKLRAEAPEYVPIKKLNDIPTIYEINGVVAHVNALSKDDKKKEDEKDQSNHSKEVATDKYEDGQGKGKIETKPTCSDT